MNPDLVPTGVAILSGAFTWSLAEYLLHRFLGHDRRTMPNFFSREHTRHHSEGNYFAPSWKKVLAGLAVTAVLSLAGVFGADQATTFGYVGGFVVMYASYEWVHRRAHTHAPATRYGAFMRRHHFHHHYGNPKANHGVTSPLWDKVFGTFEPAPLIRVPKKLVMPWLVDAAGELKPQHAEHYQLRS